MNLFVHTLINLFIIFLCAVGLYFFLFYYKKSIKKSGKNLELIEALRIDSRNMLCLVRFRNKEILLAVSANAPQLISIESEDNVVKEK